MLILGSFFGCKKKESDSKPLSPANGTYLMTIHGKGISGDMGGRDFDTTYSDNLTISGTWDSINVSCPNLENSLYILLNSTEDSLHYYKPWPPPGSGYRGKLHYSKVTHEIKLELGFDPNSIHSGSYEYTLTGK